MCEREGGGEVAYGVVGGVAAEVLGREVLEGLIQ